VTTWSVTEYLNSVGYTPSTHSSWSQYTVVLVAGDTLNARTIYNGGSSSATSINYIPSPNGSSTVNNPNPTTSQTGLDKTWSSSSFSNTNHHTRWYWFTAGVVAQKSIRILTIPSTMGWSGVQANIEQGFTGSAILTIPSSFEPFIKGTATDSGDPQLSSNGTKQERFHWRITSSSSSHSAVSVFPTNSGYFAGPSSGDSITISPRNANQGIATGTAATPPGTYYLKLYHYSPTGTSAGANTLIDTVSFNVTAAAALDTNISIPTTAFSITDSATSVSGVTMTSGATNTIYYLLNVSNFANGSNIDLLRTGNDSRYIARTFASTTGTRTFVTSQALGTISPGSSNLPSVGSFKTYYAYASNGSGTNSTRLTSGSTQVTVGRPDTTISLSPSATSISAASTSDVTVNVTGDTSGTQYRLYSNNIGSYGRWVSSYTGGQSNTTDFTISYDEAADGSAGTGTTELPSAGNTFTYYSQARATGHSAPYINTGNSFTVSRSAAASYSVSSPSSVNEGTTLTFSITTSNISNGTTVPWALTGLGTADYSTSASSPATIQNNSATVSFSILADGVADGNKTATLTLGSTDSAGSSTGGASSSTTVVDTSNPGGGGGSGSGTGGGSAGTYGLKIQNINGSTTIIDDTSRLTNFLSEDSINTNSQSSKDMFMTFDCSDKTETGFLVTWSGALYASPSITRYGATSLTITATTAGTNKVTLTGSTSVLTNGMPVYIASDVGGLYASTLYYVKNKNTNGTSIELSLTNGGNTVALSTTVLTTNPMTQVAMLRAGIKVEKSGSDNSSTTAGVADIELVRY